MILFFHSFRLIHRHSRGEGLIDEPVGCQYRVWAGPITRMLNGRTKALNTEGQSMAPSLHGNKDRGRQQAPLPTAQVSGTGPHR